MNFRYDNHEVKQAGDLEANSISTSARPNEGKSDMRDQAFKESPHTINTSKNATAQEHSKLNKHEDTLSTSRNHIRSRPWPTSRIRNTLKARQFSIIISLAFFIVICSVSVSICHIIAKSHEKDLRDEATALAIETGSWFSDELDKALLPLFSMAQFASELDIFKDLPTKVGAAYEPDALPFLPPTRPDGTVSHRNVTGVCDDPDLMARFNEIASKIKEHAKMEGVLVNIQLAPQGVVCLLHPLNNTEDFPPGVFMDNTGARGLDLLTDSSMRYFAEAAIIKDEVTIAGPLSLRQCQDCDPTVEKAFIARQPITLDGYEIMVDGVPYNKWGFATVLINWKELVDRSGIDQVFEERNMAYQLTRTDQKYDADTDSYYENVVILAETPDFNECASNRLSTTVTAALQTTNNEWEMKVAYGHNHGKEVGMASVRWKNGMISICVIVSFCISCMIFSVLAQRETQSQLLAEALARAAQFDTERNMTAYFAHEIRNPLGAVDCALKAMPDDLPKGTMELVTGMQLSVEFMSSVMNNMLDFRKIEDGKMTLLKQPLSLRETTSKVHQMLMPSVKDGVDFRLICTTGSRDWVLGDIHRIQQVIANVVTNAIKYTSSGSISLCIGWEEHTVKFECADTGPGIPKKEQDKLFQRYVQRGGAPGTGLGLALSKSIVESMGGSIRFQSDPAVKPGTSCIVLLPMNICEQPEEQMTPAKSIDAAESRAIEKHFALLIVDDIKLNRTMLKRRFLKSIAPNCVVTEACTGEEALKVCESEYFDVIIVDHYMEQAGGVMVGTDVVYALRRMGLSSHIIGCSGNTLDDKFFDAGADAMWKKPLPSNSQIIKQLRDAFARGFTTYRSSETSESTSECVMLTDDDDDDIQNEKQIHLRRA